MKEGDVVVLKCGSRRMVVLGEDVGKKPGNFWLKFQRDSGSFDSISMSMECLNIVSEDMCQGNEHKYEPRYDEIQSPSTVRNQPHYRKIYLYDICVNCGDIIERKEDNVKVV